MKTLIGGLLVVLSPPTFGVAVANTISFVAEWFVGIDSEIGRQLPQLDYVKAFSYSVLFLLFGSGMLWAGSALLREWKTMFYIAALVFGFGWLQVGRQMSPEFLIRPGMIVTGLLLMILGVIGLVANRRKAKSQPNSEEA